MRARTAAATASLAVVGAVDVAMALLSSGSSLGQLAAEAGFSAAAAMALASTYAVDHHRSRQAEALRARCRREDIAHDAWETAQLGYASAQHDDDPGNGPMARFLDRGAPPTYAELFGDSDASIDGATSAYDASDASIAR